MFVVSSLSPVQAALSAQQVTGAPDAQVQQVAEAASWVRVAGLKHKNLQTNQPFSAANTRAILKNIQSVNKECSTYLDPYKVDCLAKGLDAVADKIRNVPEYQDTKAELRRTSIKLKKIVAKYRDGQAEVLSNKPRVNPRLKKRRKIHAVKKAALKKAMAEARKVIKETETRLLRASENASRRKAHYAQLAKAVGSTKVLLRS